MSISRWGKSFVVLLATTFVLSNVPIRKDNSVRAATVINHNNDQTQEIKVFRSVEKHSYKAVVKAVSKWSGHANIEISFTNTGKETIHDWYFTFDFDYVVENPNNCNIVEHKDNLYTIANNNWNQDIGPGKTVKIGFTAASSDGSSITKNPSFYLLNSKTVSLTEKELSYKYEEYSDWGSGFNGALILTNKTNNEIRDWSVTFKSNRPITRVDSASFKNNGDDTYTIINDGNNQNIAKGSNYRLGIEGGNHDTQVQLTLSDITVSAKKLAIKLSEDKDKNGIADVRETDYSGTISVTPTPAVTSTPIPTPTNAPMSTPTNTPVPTSTPIPTSAPTIVPTVTHVPTNIPTITPTLTPSSEPTESPIPSVTPTTTPIPTGMPEDYDYDTDSDSDGLPDDLEDYYGTDKNKADTDGDGVNDFCELLLGSDPKTADNIGNLDRDADGLSNAKESDFGTNPTVRDTDMDGLSDGEEVKQYKTNPLKYDTDGDGISDYNEVQLGSNPKVPDSNVKRYQTKTLKISDNAELKGVTEVTVSGEISGSMVENTQIKDIYGKDLQTSSITALVGHPVSIESSGEFTTMSITFKYSESVNESNLRVMWFDEENSEYIELPNYSINTSRNTISVTTNHFSKYMLIDEEVWVKQWTASMRSTRSTNAIGSNWNYENYLSYIKNLPDGDEDGIPDVIETCGMITNIGTIVHTDPKKRDTDEDGLSDGYEMGAMCLTKEMINNSSFSNFVDTWYSEMGLRLWEFVFFRMTSDPNNPDSDGDLVEDDEDATPNLKNEPINYILVGRDSPEDKNKGTLIIYNTKEAYINAFKKSGEKFVVLEIYDGSDYQQRVRDSCGLTITPPPSALVGYTFQALQFDLEAEKITKKKAYSYVDKLVIDAHGLPDRIEFDARNREEGSLRTEDIDRINIACQINILDIQSCLCGKEYYTDNSKVDTCVAMNFLRKPQVQKVYAWTGSSKFLLGYNYSKDGGYYEYYKVGGNTKIKEVKTNTKILSRPSYAPLQY